MHATERQSAIVAAVEPGGVAQIGDLATSLGVSDETIRRDVRHLAARGLVRKVHGGVALPDPLRETAFRQRMGERVEAKRAIGRATAALIAPGESIILDTGTTTAYVAQALADHRDLLVVTNCTDIARSLAAGPGARVYMAGGELRADDGAVLGHQAIRFVEQFHARTAILSVGGLDPALGLMDHHVAEGEFSSAVMARAERAIVVADHAKFERRAPVRFAAFEAIDVLVTDREPPAGTRRRIEEAGVTLVVAG